MPSARVDQPAAAGLPPAAPGDTPQEIRFLPGTVIGGRYRIIALLGRGGMGEVYRADDLKLGQAVALKFLPEGLEREPDRLSRLLSEARHALRVTHANVCRVYDVGEMQGQHFLSMEYVDGEDLAPSCGASEGSRGTRPSRSLVRSAPAWRPPTRRASSIGISSPRTSCSTGVARQRSWTSGWPGSMRVCEARRSSQGRPPTWRPSNSWAGRSRSARISTH